MIMAHATQTLARVSSIPPVVKLLAPTLTTCCAPEGRPTPPRILIRGADADASQAKAVEAAAFLGPG